jgi:hypothetical protein
VSNKFRTINAWRGNFRALDHIQLCWQPFLPRCYARFHISGVPIACLGWRVCWALHSDSAPATGLLRLESFGGG